MTGAGWAIFALLSAAFTASLLVTNQYMRQPGHVLVFWLRVFVVMLLTPFMPHLPLPHDPVFYVTVVCTMLAGTFADIRALNVSAAFGAGVVSRVQPVTVIGAFFLWFLFDPSLLRAYAARPWNTAAVLAALLGCVYFAMRLNRCDVTRRALIAMAPALAGYTLTTVLNKFAMGRGQVEGTVFGYMYVQSVAAVFAVGGYIVWREREKGREKRAETDRPSWVTKRLAGASLLAALLWITSMTWKNYAMAFTPNPSYVGALMLTAPVFIVLFYRVVKFKEEADVASGMGIVFCAVVLALAAAH